MTQTLTLRPVEPDEYPAWAEAHTASSMLRAGRTSAACGSPSARRCCSSLGYREVGVYMSLRLDGR
jgi:hypothetical protein